MSEHGSISFEQPAGPNRSRSNSHGSQPPSGEASPKSVHQPRSRDPSQEPGVFNHRLVEEAEAVVQNFRRGTCTKSEALGKLFTLLDVAGDHPNHEGRVAAFKQYWDDIEEEAQREEEAGERGQRILDAGNFRRLGSGRGRANTALEDHLADLERFVSRKRRGGDREEDDDFESDAGDGKRTKLDRSQLPWGKKDDDDASAIAANPGGVENRRLLRLFAINPSFVVSDIRLSALVPQGFPSSEWTNIVKGLPVNLDNVLSALHHVHPPKENVGRLGEREISLGTNKPAKIVETQADWHSAWTSAARAYSFVFEHRQKEIETYGQYILQLFAAKVPSAGKRVILYDKAIRNFIGGGQRHALTDTAAYSNLREAILASDGVEAQGAGVSGSPSRNRGGRGGGGSDGEICIRFNQAGGCNWKDGACKYRHVCKACGKDGHGRAACKGAGGERA